MSKPESSINPLPPLSPVEYEALRESIRRDGFLYPVIMSAGPANFGEVVDGFNRLAIGEELGLEVPRISKRFASEAEFKLAQIDANLQRRQLTVPQRVMLAMAREPWERKLARDRQKAGVAGEKPGTALRASAVAAEAVGLKRDTYEHGKFVIDKAPAEIRAQFLAGGLSVHRAYRETKRALGINSSAVLTASLGKRVGALPEGSWSCVVVVPPWRSGKGAEKGRLAVQEIAALDVRSVLAQNALVVLLAPVAQLGEAYGILAGWGAQSFGFVALSQGAKVSEVAVLARVGRGDLAGYGHIVRTEAGNLAPLYDLLDSLEPDAEGLSLFDEPKRAGWKGWKPTVR